MGVIASLSGAAFPVDMTLVHMLPFDVGDTAMTPNDAWRARRDIGLIAWGPSTNTCRGESPHLGCSTEARQFCR